MNDLNALRFSAAAFATRNDIADTKFEFSYNLQDLGKQVNVLESLPSFPVILSRLMDLLARPPIETDFDEVIELISGDSAIAARCVSMANSASFGRRRHIESVHDAVINLGLWRISEIVFSCQLPEIFHAFPQGIDSQTFWRHSLACAIISQRLGRAVRADSAEKAYLAGLLHDIGILVSAALMPDASNVILQRAASKSTALNVVEKEILGFDHADTGGLLARTWQLTPDIIDVIQYHHDIESAPSALDLVALVHLSDLFCREHGLGYGYHEERRIDFTCSPAWLVLVQTCRRMGRPPLKDLFQDLEDYYPEMRAMVDGFCAAAHPVAQAR
jgi:putative nucleotidyltransferase with HDIG domain